MFVLYSLLGLLALSSAAPASVSTSSSALPTPTEYNIPQVDGDIEGRRLEVEQKRAGITYGPAILGETSFFPNGTLGNQIVLRDQDLWVKDQAPVGETVAREAAAVLADIEEHGELQGLDDYRVLYDGHWVNSVPGGTARGQLDNMTSDLLFSMERLSVNPYILRRLHPNEDEIPYDVDAQVVDELTDRSLSALHEQGRLFFADHSYQLEYEVQPGRYTAACQALFYLDERSDQLLPLAIKTNVGANLTYTPLDEPNDWLLAKVMFSVNDLFHGQMYHLASVHAVAEIVYLAALRTLSSRHPVLALLDRIMFQAYGVRPVGSKILFNPGGLFDQSFALSSDSAKAFAGDAYPTIGRFRSNFFEEDLRSRGLLDAAYGPSLPNFPFFEDGSRIIGVIGDFVEAFVQSLYGADSDIVSDWELQDWIAEANGPAEVLDFLPSLDTREQLVDIITHLAWLTGASHHVLNQGEPFTTSGVLPLHPASLYAPVPEEKGTLESLLPWLPNITQSVQQISLLARFNRPQVVQDRETLQYMFSVPSLLSATDEVVAAANDRFIEEMQLISDELSGREFDSDGLSQGMPFIWEAMDPGVVPFYLSV